MKSESMKKLNPTSPRDHQENWANANIEYTKIMNLDRNPVKQLWLGIYQPLVAPC